MPVMTQQISPSAVESRSPVQSLRASRIREVANAGMGRADVLPFWFGEPDEVTPAFIRDVAKQALDEGDTFYTQNFGLPALREALAAYSSRLHRPTSAANIAVTSSGTQDTERRICHGVTEAQHGRR